jgi:hypothetical protein
MGWHVYQLVFRLRSPLHIGLGKVGNVQLTRSYVTGKVFWGALTTRLTRDKNRGPATDSNQYKEIGNVLHDQLVYTYFYPATSQNGTYQIAYPWEEKSLFRRRFLSSYPSTALIYPQQAAAEGLLHEVEFISPRTLDTGEAVYLMGYVFEKDDCQLQWQQGCHKLQMGGERGYGWGSVECVQLCKTTHEELFNGKARWKEENSSVVIEISEPNHLNHLLAHSVAQHPTTSIEGELEPLVGREWRSHNPTNRYAGQHLEFHHICWAPGSRVKENLDFAIREFGIWYLV